MELSYEVLVKTKKEIIWPYYEDISNWFKWEDDLLDIQLEGAFETNTNGVMTLQGMPPLQFVLTEVEPLVSFWDETVTPMGTVSFGHVITELNGDEVKIKHIVSLKDASYSLENLTFLKQIFDDVPHSVMKLKSLVEAL